MKSIGILALLLSCLPQLVSQNFWRLNLGSPFPEKVLQIHQTSDGNLLTLAVRDDQFQTAGIWLIKCTLSGQKLWEKDFNADGFEIGRSLVEAPDGTLYIAGVGLKSGITPAVLLYHLTADGVPLGRWFYDEYKAAYSMVRDNDGNMLLGLGSTFNRPAGVLKVDPAGNQLGGFEFQIERKTIVNGIQLMPNGAFLLAGRADDVGASGFHGVFFARFDAFGANKWVHKVAYPEVTGIMTEIALPLAWQADNSILVPFSFQKKTLLKHIAADGTVLPDKTVDLFPGSDGDVLAMYNDGPDHLLLVGAPAYTARVKISDIGQLPLWLKQYKSNVINLTAASRLPGKELVLGGAQAPLPGKQDMLLFRADSLGYELPSAITGTVWFDTNGNCQRDPGEAPAAGLTVETTDQSLRAITGSDGSYVIRADTGKYILQLSRHAPVMWLPGCDPVQYTALSVASPVGSVNFGIQAVNDCPALETAITAPGLVRCDTANYFINTCNRGNATAFGARLRLQVDDRLLFLESSDPYFDTGDAREYELGDLAPGECHQISVTVQTPCALPLGVTCCVEASVTPDAICWERPDPQWTGAEIRISSRCHKGRAEFTVHNTGTGPTTVPYRLFEDDALSEQGSLDLAPGDSATFWRPGLGRTVQLHTGQAPGYPGLSRPSAILETCGLGENGFYSHGFYNMLPANDANPAVSTACEPVSDIYGRGHIAEHVVGFGSGHWITPGLENEYTIRLYNPLATPVDSVVVWLSPSSDFDTLSFQPLACSHPYTWAWASPGIARFVLKGSGLMPFAADKRRGSAFIHFRIKPYPDLPVPNPTVNFGLLCHATAAFGQSTPVELEPAYSYIFTGEFPTEIKPLAPDEKGMKYFGPGVLDFGSAVAKTPQGYLYIAGSSTGYGRTSCVSLIRANAQGVGQWHRLFDLGAPVYVTGAETTENGRCIISGVVRTHGNKPHLVNSSAFLLCVNSKGEIVWKKIFRIAGKGTVSDDLIATTDGAFLLSGKTENGSGGAAQWFLYKFRPDGDSLWLNTVFQTGYYSQPYENDLAVSADGGCLISSLQENSLHLFKITAQGQLIWTRQHPVSTNNLNVAVSRAHDGGYLVCLGQLYAPYLIRFDQLGNKLWGKDIPIPPDELWRFQDIAPALVDNGFLLACEQSDPLPDSWNAGLIKIDDTGQVMWTETYRSYSNVAEHVYQLLPTVNTIYMVGNTQISHLYSIYKINTLLIMSDHKGKLIGTQYTKEAEPAGPRPRVSLQPNPVSENLLVEWLDAKPGSLCWALLDNQSRLLRQGFEETDNFTVFVGDLPEGAYWLQLTSETGGSVVELVQVNR